ncbi:unnamed protein product [Periconia digitata]|uniref:branched-chain-amino-acid transaminase n=1 Tax=Periconia digitata TaxID=1303443 RepID=A0A9W4XW79_9PLEO|nr:unnamed protein product [Periconia digitata]
MDLLPFDNRDGQIWFDGKFVPWRNAKIHALSHGLHYGSSVFEGERSYGGTIFKLRVHTDRLINSGRMLGFNIPYEADRIDAACRQVIKTNGLTDAYVRPLAWRGSEQMGVAASRSKIHLMIAAWAWPNPHVAKHLEGIRLDISHCWLLPPASTMPVAAKAAGLYTTKTLVKHMAEANGFDDALMMDVEGMIGECTGANIFLVFNGEIHTPIPHCFLDGITRRTAIDLLRKRGHEVVERKIPAQEIAEASEVFITGTACEITRVQQIGDFAFISGEITATLIADYRDLVLGKTKPKI